MDHSHSTAPQSLAAPHLLRTSTVVYGIMSLLGLAIIFWGHKTLPLVLGLPLAQPIEIVRLAGVGALGAGLLIVLSYFFENWFSSYRDLKDTMTRMLGPCSAFTAIYLAAISAFAEEVLFRGAIQPFAGLILTSILFGLLHLGADRRVTAWSIWAVISGLLLGWICEETQSLWPPIVAHFGVNAVALLNFRRSYRNYVRDAATIVGKLEKSDSGDQRQDQ